MRISRFLSYILHPIFMPLLALYIILNYIDFFNILFFSYTKPLYLIVSVFTLVLPLIFILISLKFNTISSLEMSTKEERNRPLFYTIIIMIIGFSPFQNISQLSPYLTSVYLSSIIILVIAFLITKKWKISLHMLGIGGATGSFIALNIIFGGLYYWIILFLFLSGLLAFSRLSLNAHTKDQVYTGFFLGCLLQTFFILYFNSTISTISIFLSSIASLL